MTIKYPSTRHLIRQISEHAKQFESDDLSFILKFIRYFYSYTSLEDLEGKSIEMLYGIAVSQWRLMRALENDEVNVKVFNPTMARDGWSSPRTIIQIVLKDIPFLVDSLRIEINRMKLNYDLMVHMGGMLVVRDDAGNVTQLLRYKGQEIEHGLVEAPIFIEIDQQTSPEKFDEIKDNLLRVIKDVREVVRDWTLMQEKMRESIADIKASSAEDNAEANEACSFLSWLLKDNFTFIGVRDYEISGSGARLALRLVKGSGLGVLADDSNSKTHRLLADLPEQARHLILSSENRIIISKTNTISTVHRPVYTDYIGVKYFDKENKLVGERRFIGLYTSTAYSSDPLSIPFVRHKVSRILKKSQLPWHSHSGKDLRHILANLPRDDLFQATTTELYNLSMDILHLQERRCIRLFAREDAYGRYMSCLVYVPRENFNTKLLRAIQTILMSAFHGIEFSFNTSFSESLLARIHFVIRIDSKKPRQYDLLNIERQLIEAGKSWSDELYERLIEYHGNVEGNQIFTEYKSAFPTAYREAFSPQQAVFDMNYMMALTQDDELSMTVYRPVSYAPNMLKFKLFRIAQIVPLSDALPILENLGFRVLGEEPYKLSLKNGQVIWINDFSMEYIYGDVEDLPELSLLLEEAFLAIWEGRAESDEFNHLVIYARFDWCEISIFRALAKYFLQIGTLPFSLQYIAETFIHNPKVAQVLMRLFHCRFNPQETRSKETVEKYEKEFYILLDSVQSLDEDRIFRSYLDLLNATLRTNFYQYDISEHKSYLSFKFSSKNIPNLPLPVPAYEIFVYSPDFEGVHLRMAKVARGGLRWSDRREDFRTEILGLMKAQQVKNALIVPSGAKGGFVVKKSIINLTREQIFEQGIRCYQGFINGLLDITDNIVDGKIVHPDMVVVHDDEDPYLVVAADKGTASFSDIANQISLDKGFWLGDAFASGGSTGYDHKKMGITARGAWVSAERQFQELGVNVDQAPIRVIGIGDMAGDVFGNGMLLSNNMKLVAAFNYMHIFVDPDPDPAISFEERKRLFELPRSSWRDYNPELISAGGGVFERKAKSITLTPEMQALIDTNQTQMIPNDFIRALLKAPVDMIWNGGIGTFVKATKESDASVGDRTNDAIRVCGKHIRARVICEGGNLGVTQLGRIEYELHGGKINTDFIDNSAGVDCSDHEVNIKILLNEIVSKGELTLKQRNDLLLRMTKEVAELVLQHNYAQNQTLSVAAHYSSRYIDVYRRFIQFLEDNGKINRALEFLPPEKVFVDRKSADLGLTKPELAVLISYAKIVIEDALRHSDIVYDPVIQRSAIDAFPTPLRHKYENEIKMHRLYPEITATQISNRMVSDMGITFAYIMFDETGASLDAITRAYTVSQAIFHMQSIYGDIESLDYKVSTDIQYQMMTDVKRLVRRASRWFLRNRRDTIHIQETIDIFTQHTDSLYKSLPKLLVGSDREHYEQRCEQYMDAGVPAEIAYKVSSTDAIFHALNIVEVARLHNFDYYLVARTYFAVVDSLELLWFRDLIDKYPNDTHWMILAKAAYKGDLDWIQRELALSVLNMDSPVTELHDRMKVWLELHGEMVQRWESVVTRLKGTEIREFPMLSVAIRELSDITKVV